MKQGAYDYLKKPFDIDEVAVVIERALEARRLRIDNRRLSAEQTLGRRIIGASRPMRRLLEATTRVAGRDVTVLVRGETGTGKEFVAELLQSASGEAPSSGAPSAAFEAHDAGDEHTNGAAPDARHGPSLKEQVEAFERGLVARALDGTGGNQSEAARRLGVSRVTLIDKMKKYGLGNPKR